MTQQQLIETVQQHHPEMSDTQVRLYLNNALKEFCRKTRILKSVYSFSTGNDVRYYKLESNMAQVTRLDYDGYQIPRLIHAPEKTDLV